MVYLYICNFAYSEYKYLFREKEMEIKKFIYRNNCKITSKDNIEVFLEDRRDDKFLSGKKLYKAVANFLNKDTIVHYCGFTNCSFCNLTYSTYKSPKRSDRISRFYSYKLTDFNIEHNKFTIFRDEAFPIFLKALECSLQNYYHLDQLPILIKSLYLNFLNEKYKTNNTLKTVLECFFFVNNVFVAIKEPNSFYLAFATYKPVPYYINCTIIPTFDESTQTCIKKQSVVTLKELVMNKIICNLSTKCIKAIYMLELPKSLSDECALLLRKKIAKDIYNSNSFLQPLFNNSKKGITSMNNVKPCKICNNRVHCNIIP